MRQYRVNNRQFRDKTFPHPLLNWSNTVKPHYNEVLGTMKITLLYQVSHYIRVKKLRIIKSWDQQNYLVIRGFCYIRPLYNEVPLYYLVAPLYKACLSVTRQVPYLKNT